MKNSEVLLWNSQVLKGEENILAGFGTYMYISMFFREGMYPEFKTSACSLNTGVLSASVKSYSTE